VTDHRDLAAMQEYVPQMRMILVFVLAQHFAVRRTAAIPTLNVEQLG
jgi:hypothetical protein